MEKRILDDDLGEIVLRTHPRSTRYTVKVTRGSVVGTMPVGGDTRLLIRLIHENKEKLQQHLSSRHRLQLNEQTRLQTYSFALRIVRHSDPRFVLSLNGGELRIACPQDALLDTEEVQGTLRRMLEAALRHEAKRLLPFRLMALARQHGFVVRSVKIQGSKGRWGSCSSSKNINLSLSLMLLPEPLIDYVLLHELCHTVEMNHSERFWNELDRVTGNRAKALRLELSKHHPLT